jgi:Flp pilus assembly pilin Flp
MKKLIAFFKDEDGMETPEYAVMGTLIVIALVVAISALSDDIGAAFGRIGDIVAGRTTG